MSRKAKVAALFIGLAAVIGLVAAFAWPVIYRDVIAQPAADTPSVSEPAGESAEIEGTGDALEADKLAGEWLVTEGSEAGYRVDEVLRGTDVTVTGRTTQVTGSVTSDGESLTAADIVIDVASITTDRSSRDSYFRDSAMRVSEHPTATFTLTDAATPAEPPVSGEPSELQLTGTLTLAGVTQDVTFTTEWVTDGTLTRVAGAIPITFADYGVEAPSLGFVKVEPEGFVEFTLTLTR